MFVPNDICVCVNRRRRQGQDTMGGEKKTLCMEGDVV